MSNPQSLHNLSQREAIHDLRNLFGVIASARRLAQVAPERCRDQWLAAIDAAAARGGEVTNHLLGAGPHPGGERLDLHACLMRLAPQLSALTDPAALEFHTVPGPSARLTVATLEAIVIELVRNARRAGARRLRLRLRAHARSSWLILADDGLGLSRARLEAARRTDGGVQGSGLPRILRAVEAAGGRVRLHSRPGAGAVLALIFPDDPHPAGPVGGGFARRAAALSASSKDKETVHEEVR